MKTREARRQAVLEEMAKHILKNGLSKVSLRPLAVAAGTSDRMLMYYFADKNDLLKATLELLAKQLLNLLNDALPESEEFFEVLLAKVCQLMLSPTIEPYMKVWLELVAFAARNEEPFRTIAGGIYDGFHNWISLRLRVENGNERFQKAALLLQTVEGFVLLSAIGRGETLQTS